MLAGERKHTEELFAGERRHTDEMFAAERKYTEEMFAAERKHTEEMFAAERKHTEEMFAAERKHTEEMFAAERKHTEQLLAKQSEQLHTDMMTVIESEIMPKLRTLAEGQEVLLDRIVPVSRIEAIESDIIVLKAAVSHLSEKVTSLEKAE